MGGIRRHKRRHRNRNKTEPKNDEQVSKTVNVNYYTIIIFSVRCLLVLRD